MNQSELIEKVAQATELNQAVAGQAVKAVANAILDALVAGEEVRVSGLGIFKVAARPAREGRNPQTGEAIQIAASKAVRFHAGKAAKDALNPPTQKGAPRKAEIRLDDGRTGFLRVYDPSHEWTTTDPDAEFRRTVEDLKKSRRERAAI